MLRLFVLLHLNFISIFKLKTVVENILILSVTFEQFGLDYLDSRFDRDFPLTVNLIPKH